MSRAFVPVKFEAKSGEVVGYANAPIVDRGDANYRDLIPAELWLKALTEFFATGAPINFMHRRKFIVGETVSVEVSENGPLLKTVPTKQWVYDAIQAGDIKGYSIEYKLYEAELMPPTGGDPRPVRRFKSFSLVRVSYVDEPMNPGSYFQTNGGKNVNLKDFQIKFDRDNGLVTIVAKNEDAMASISSYLADGIKNHTVLEDVRAVIGVKADEELGEVKYEIKAEAPESIGLRQMMTNFIDEFKSALKDGSGNDGGSVDPVALKSTLDNFLVSLKELDLDGEKFQTIEAQIAEIKNALPEGEKSLADTLKDLQAKASDTTLADAVAENTKAIQQIAEVVNEALGGKTAIDPVGSKGAREDADRWGSYPE